MSLSDIPGVCIPHAAVQDVAYEEDGRTLLGDVEDFWFYVIHIGLHYSAVFSSVVPASSGISSALLSSDALSSGAFSAVTVSSGISSV